MSKLDWTQFISAAAEAVCSAGNAIDDLFGLPAGDLDTSVKADETPVTRADHISEKIIAERLGNQFPTIALLREEAPSELDEHQEFVCLIDPLDGTSSFARGIPTYGIQVGLAQRTSHGGHLVASVVYEPQTGRLWQAARGCGAFMWKYDKAARVPRDRRRISVSRHDTSESDSGMLIYDAAVRFRDIVPDQESKIAILSHVLPLFRRVRMIGSLALQFAYVASGYAEATVADAIGGPYDLCGHLLVDEAGGRTTDLRMQPIDVFTCRVALGTNGSRHGELAEVLRNSYEAVWRNARGER